MKYSPSSIQDNPLEKEFFFSMCKFLAIVIILGLVAVLIWYFFLRKKSSGTTTSGTKTSGTTTINTGCSYNPDASCNKNEDCTNLINNQISCSGYTAYCKKKTNYCHFSPPKQLEYYAL